MGLFAPLDVDPGLMPEMEAHARAGLTCMNDPRWNDLSSTRRFMELIGSGRARVDVRVYDVVAARDAP